MHDEPRHLRRWRHAWWTSQLGYMIARYVFGRSAEFRRIAADDEQVQTALSLLAQGVDDRRP